MTPEELAKSVNEKIDAFKTDLGNKVTQSDIDKSFEELKTSLSNVVTKEELKKLEDIVAEQGKFAEQRQKAVDNIIKATLEANKENIEKFVKNKSGSLEIEFKATQTSTDIAGRDNYFTWHEGGRIGQIPVRRTFMRELFPNRSTSNEYVKYTDQATVVRDAKNVALCGETTHNTKATWEVYDLKVDKVRDFTTICQDMMDDYAFVESEIRNLLESSLALKIDNDLLLGTGISPILNGVAKYASTFDPALTGADYTDSVEGATLIDLLSIAGAQIKFLGQNNSYMPNVIVLNPKEAQLMKLLKDSDLNYISTNSVSPTLFQNSNGQLFVDGMQVIENQLVPENEAYIFDSSKGTVYSRPGIGVEFAYENRENFEQELVTAKVFERLNFLVRTVDSNAFMHIDDITAGIAAIEKP